MRLNVMQLTNEWMLVSCLAETTDYFKNTYAAIGKATQGSSRQYWSIFIQSKSQNCNVLATLNRNDA